MEPKDRIEIVVDVETSVADLQSADQTHGVATADQTHGVATADQTHGVTTADQTGGTNQNQGVQAGGLQETSYLEGQRTVSMMPKVEPYVRNKYVTKNYDPLVASFGLYNRKFLYSDDQPLAMVEDFKSDAMKWFVGGTDLRDANFWFDKVWYMVPDLRRCYTEESAAMYSNAELTRLFFRDACLIIMLMEVATLEYHEYSDFFCSKIGVDTVLTILRDSFLLENQLPFWFIRTLLHIKYGERKGEKRWRRHIVTFAHGGKPTPSKLYWDEDADEPPHFVVALKLALVHGRKRDKNREKNKQHATANEEDDNIPLKPYYAIRSVTQLKAKGINVKRNKTNSFKQITFDPDSFSGATLRFPVDKIGYWSSAVYANLIAYEMSSENSEQDYTITAYSHLMKSLLQSSADVEELQAEGIIVNMLGSNEQVMSLYRDIYTIGANCSQEYKELCQKMENHYNNKTKTWLAEFLHTYFRSPWTVIALLGSLFILGLTITQTYYAASEGRKGSDKGTSRA